MSNASVVESEAFQDAWNACGTIFEALNVLGFALRRASGNPAMRQFRQAAGESAFSAYYEELHPLTDADIDYVLGKMAWQASRVEAQLPKLPYSRYKEARVLLKQDDKLQRYVDRANEVSQAAWWGARYLYSLSEIDDAPDARAFVASVRRLGLPNRDMQLTTACNLILSCKPTYMRSGQLRTGGGFELDNFARAYLGTFGHDMITLLHTWVPTADPVQTTV